METNAIRKPFLVPYVKKNKVNIIIVSIFLILPWIFFNDSIKISSVIFGDGDPNYYTLPLWDLAVTSVKNGEFPFWNRYIFSGFPFFANPQTSILYPVLWILYLIFPLSVAYSISIMLHYSLAGIFTYLFLNRYKLDKLASFVGGLIFMFSGLMIMHKGHAQMLYVAVWFPLILYYLDRFRDSRKFEFILLGSVFYAFAFFGGHPQIFLYGSMLVFLYIIYYSFIHTKKSFYFLLSFTIFIITGLLLSIQLFPVYELIGHSVRSGLDYGTFTFLSYTEKLIPTFISPFIYGGGPSGVQFFGGISLVEQTAYFGVTTLTFLIIGLFSKNRDKYFWIFLLILSFVLVMGINTPFYKLMFQIPVYNKFRIPTRNWFEFGLAFSILAGFGFDHFIKNFNKKIKIIIIVIISLLGTIGIFLGFSNIIIKKISSFEFFNTKRLLIENFELLLKTTNFKNYAVYLPLILIFITIALLILSFYKRNKYVYVLFIILIFFDLRSLGNYIEGSSNASYINKDLTEYEEFYFTEYENEPYRFYPGFRRWYAEGTIWPNKNIHYEVDLVSGYDPLVLREYNIITMMVCCMDSPEHIEYLMRNNNILSMLNLKYILYYKQEDYSEFKRKITKVLYEDIGTVINDNSMNNAILKNVQFKDKKSLLFKNDTNVLKYIKIPIEIDKNENYLVSLEIKENVQEGNKSLIDNNIFIDFLAEDYDSVEQEFFLNPEEISSDYKIIRKEIFSGDAPAGKEVYLRIFTYSDGEIEIRNIEVNKINIHEYNDYSIVYHKDILVLKNNDYLPRFYFSKKIRNVFGIEEASSILHETGGIWIDNRFDPKVETLVEKIDFSSKEFNIDNAQIEIQEYTNNRVKLNVSVESDSFLVFSDSYYPGWKAYINGQEVKIYKTNGIVKGIFIPEGKHIVEFNYLPINFWIYFSISVATFTSIIALLILGKKRIKGVDLNKK